MFKNLNKPNNQPKEDDCKELSFKSNQHFLNINNKINHSFEHLKKYNELAREVKKLARKITYFDNTDEFHESMNLKRQKKKLETELIQLDDLLHSEKMYISDSERNEFDNENQQEREIISNKTKEAYNNFVKKSEELAESYKDLVELRNEYGLRQKQKSYVDSNVEQLRGDLTTARKSLFNHRVGVSNINPGGKEIEPRSMVQRVVLKHLWEVEDNFTN